MRAPATDFERATFRVKVLTASMFAIVALAMCALYAMDRSVSAERQHQVQRALASDLVLLRTQRDIRHASLADRCCVLVRKPRIRASLEDGARDLLYPSAKDAFADARSEGVVVANDAITRRPIRPRFFRFLNSNGAIIPPMNAVEAGTLGPGEEEQIIFPAVPQNQQNGYFVRSDNEIIEVIATPIVSMESGEVIAALVAGFTVTANEPPQAGLQSGLWLDGKLQLPAVAEPARTMLERFVADSISRRDEVATKGLLVVVVGAEQMLVVERLNPGSLFPPAYEVDTFPTAGLLSRRGGSR